MTNAPDAEVKIDEGEIHDYQWIKPKDALSRTPSSDFLIMPPTFVSLFRLKDFSNTQQALADIASSPTEYFLTKFSRIQNGFVTCWEGDCAYEDFDFSKAGPRRRLTATPKAWHYDVS